MKDNREEWDRFGTVCVGVCKALSRGLDGRDLGGLSDPLKEAIDELEM